MNDLKLDEGDGTMDISDKAGVNVPETESVTIEEGQSKKGVKALSVKSSDDIKIIFEEYKNGRSDFYAGLMVL